jgi:hypothetical protein
MVPKLRCLIAVGIARHHGKIKHTEQDSTEAQ